MSLCYLTIFVLHEEALHSVHHTWLTARYCGTTSRFHSNQTCRSVHKTRKYPHCIRSAAHTCNYEIGSRAGRFIHLNERFVTNYAMKLTHHERVRMRAHDRTEAVMSGLDRRHPVTHRFVNCVLQCATTRSDTLYFCSEKAHTKHVEFLSCNINFAHVHLALKSKQRRSSCRCNTMLSCTSFGNNSLFAHAFGQQHLTENVIDFVGTSVIEIFTF